MRPPTAEEQVAALLERFDLLQVLVEDAERELDRRNYGLAWEKVRELAQVIAQRGAPQVGKRGVPA